LEQRLSLEKDLTEKSELRKMARRLRTVHGELADYNELIKECVVLEIALE
jgi:serine/threonine-protein kinase RIO1